MKPESAVKKRILPPRYLAAAVASMTALGLLPGGAIIPSWARFCGLPLLVLGVGLNLVADRMFKARRTTVQPFAESSVLVTDGVFALSRNPMYLGMGLALLAYALMLGRAAPLVVVPVFVVGVDRVFIRHEEAALARQFGDVFACYRLKVRRWL